MSVLVFTDSLNKEITKSSFEAVVYGAKVASDIGTSCIAVSYGDVTESSLSALGKYGIIEFDFDTYLEAEDVMRDYLAADTIIQYFDLIGIFLLKFYQQLILLSYNL